MSDIQVDSNSTAYTVSFEDDAATDASLTGATKQKFGAIVRSRVLWKQFRALVIKCVVHNVEQGFPISRRGMNVRHCERKWLLNTEDVCSFQIIRSI